MPNRRKKSRFEAPFMLLKLISLCVLKPFFLFEVRGLEYLHQQTEGLILAGNHTGFLDSMMLFAAVNRPFRFLMTEEVFDWGIIGKLVRYGNIIPIYTGRELKALTQTLRHLANREAICIFPEGKLTRDGKLNPFNPGVAFLQKKSGVPVIPFAIHGGFEAWPQSRKLPVFRKIILQFGPPIEPALCANRQQMVQTLEERVRALKNTLANTPDEKPGPQTVS